MVFFFFFFLIFHLDTGDGGVVLYSPFDEIERRHTVSTRKTGGVRRRFREYLDEGRMSFPRGPRKRNSKEWIKLEHREPWYYDGHLVNRPLFGLLGLGKLSELWLNRVAFSRNRGLHAFVPDVMWFYADVSRVMQNVLSSYPIDERLPEEGVRAARDEYLRLCEDATGLAERIDPEPCECPLCGTKGAVVYEFDILKAILSDPRVRNLVPPGTRLAELVDLTPVTVL